MATAWSADKSMETLFADGIKTTTSRVNEVQKRFSELETTPGGIAQQEKIAEVRKHYLEFRGEMMEAKNSGDSARAAAMLQEFRAKLTEYMTAVSAIVDFEAQRTKSLNVDVEEAMSFMQIVTIIFSAGGAGAAMLFGTLMYRQTVPALLAARVAADRVAHGDLRRDIMASNRDEVGLLMQSLSAMQISLRSLVGDIHQSADSIGTTSQEVASGNQDLSARTEQTASSLQQTASSVQQIASTVRLSAESAKQANKLAQEASDVASKGGDAVVAVVKTMDGIQASSQKISDIIGVIDGIAFQTNILALNAAVEAARAGEQGRGFAVVATEVRALAQRSAAAAKEIKSLIGKSVEQVDVGSKQAHQAGQTLKDVVSSVGRVTSLVGEISTATAEQAKGIEEINKAVAQLDHATQQNAALVEESAATAECLKDQASNLSQSVQQFKLAN
jgi:methyl-accepting chemotaxis protein